MLHNRVLHQGLALESQNQQVRVATELKHEDLAKFCANEPLGDVATHLNQCMVHR